MGYGYSVELSPEDEDVTAKAAGREMEIKPRDAVNICKVLRGKPLTWAKDYLRDVIDKKQAVPYPKHNLHVSHRKGNMAAGKYPVKASKGILSVLENAEANAEYKGLDPETMDVWHIAMQKAAPLEGQMPRAQGRATAWNTARSHIEVVLREQEE